VISLGNVVETQYTFGLVVAVSLLLHENWSTFVFLPFAFNLKFQI